MHIIVAQMYMHHALNRESASINQNWYWWNRWGGA